MPEDDSVQKAAQDLMGEGCTLILSDHFGHQFHLGDLILKNRDTTFVSLFGDMAASSGLPNWYNACNDNSQSQYVAGVAAGLKLKELAADGTLTRETLPLAFDENNRVRIGFVGAFDCPAVVSAYTAFYLGVKSVYDPVDMIVEYTNSWNSETRDAEVAQALLDLGCVVLGQMTDTNGATKAVSAAKKADPNLVCVTIGSQEDLTKSAPETVLVSTAEDWSVYFTTLFRAAALHKKIPQDWCHGFDEKAVGITGYGTACAPDTKKVCEKTADALARGKQQVFDCSTFTVMGQPLTTYTQAKGLEEKECIKKIGGVTCFAESTLRSAPYFDVRIDGITELESAYTAGV